jgi:uncharacterized membrane protein HdeD (DUF308 family)
MAVESTLQKAWSAIAFRGLVGVVLGIVAFTWPQVTLSALLVVLGAYFFLDGIFALVASFQASRHEQTWWPYLLQGLLSVAVGILAFTRPMAVALFVLFLVAFRCFVTGVVEIATGIWLRRETGRSEWLLWLAGLLSIAFGVILLARPAAGALTLVWLVGIYTFAFGIIETLTAFRLKRFTGPRHLAEQPS